MKTDDLIAMLAKDTTPVPKTISPRVLLTVAIGAIAAFAVLAPWLGMRPDLMDAMKGWVFWTKAAYTAALGIAGFVLVERLSRPGASGRMGAIIAALAILAILALAMSQMMSMPPDEMHAAMMGSSWDKCPWRIFVLSLPGLAAILWLMRRFAPTNAWAAGAGAGLLAGGVGATVYGLHCQEFAMPFVALWYSLGVLLTALAGAIIGSRLLRW